MNKKIVVLCPDAMREAATQAVTESGNEPFIHTKFNDAVKKTGTRQPDFIFIHFDFSVLELTALTNLGKNTLFRTTEKLEELLKKV